MSSIPSNNQSLWRDTYPAPLYTPLTDDITVDVIVIGAGITGLTTAYLLKKAGLQVAVIDKDTIGGGTTGRTTGKVTSQHNLMYADMEKRYGTPVVGAYATVNQAAVEMVASIIQQEKIACDWQRDDNFVFTSDPSKVTQFKQEAEAAARLGLPASFVTELGLPFPVQAAVRFSDQGKFSAQKYLLGLAAAVHGGGSYVFEHSTAIGIHDGTPCRVRTSSGGMLTGRDIVVATNVPTLPLMARGGYCILEYPNESYIISGNYQHDLSGMYISPDKEHYSILPITVDGERQLLVGGSGHLSGLRGSKKWRFNRLASYAAEQFGLTAIDHAWSDRDYLAYDEIPLVGKLYPWSKHLYVGTAFKKWGLTNGTAAAMMLRDLITDIDNPHAAFFTPHRLSPITSIPRAVVKQIQLLANP